MAQQTLNNGISGSAFRTILNENFTDLYTNKCVKNHASDTTDFGVASAVNFGHVKVASNTGLNIANGVLSGALASQAQATEGVSNLVLMTPARVKEAVTAYSVISDGNVIIKIGSTRPSAQSGKTIIWIDTSS